MSSDDSSDDEDWTTLIKETKEKLRVIPKATETEESGTTTAPKDDDKWNENLEKVREKTETEWGVGDSSRPVSSKETELEKEDSYTSGMSWNQLNEKIVKESGMRIPKTVLEAPSRDLKGCAYWSKWPTPSKPQAEFLPVFFKKYFLADENHHFVVQAKNGAGKTGVYMMCALSGVNPKIQKPQCVIVVRSFELVKEVWQKTAMPLCTLSNYPPPGILTYGYDNLLPQAEKSPIVIAQYGYLMKVLKERRFTAVQNLKLLVFDEADELIKGSRGGALGSMVRNLFSSLERAARGGRNWIMNNVRTFFISATFEKEELDCIEKTLLKSSPRVNRVIIDNEEALLIKKMSIFHVDVSKYANDRDRQESYNSIVHFFVNEIAATQTIIFCEERKIVHALGDYLKKNSILASLLTGKPMENEVRERNLSEFRDRKTSILITTSVISRGIDIPSVDLVVNLGIPRKGFSQRGSKSVQKLEGDGAMFRHRIGRTARFGRKGVAITVTNNRQENEFFTQICRQMDLNKERIHRFEVEHIKEESEEIITVIDKILKGE